MKLSALFGVLVANTIIIVAMLTSCTTTQEIGNPLLGAVPPIESLERENSVLHAELNRLEMDNARLLMAIDEINNRR